MGELLNNPAQNVRLPAFAEQQARLLSYSALLDRLDAFKRDHAGSYIQVRDFFNRVVNASVDLPDVRRFIEDWRTGHPRAQRDRPGALERDRPIAACRGCRRDGADCRLAADGT